MRLAELIVRQRTVVVFSCLLLMLAGAWSYFHLGQLEDPEYTLKTALVITRYPGASPAEVEQQVTDVIEKAVQRLDRLDKVRSISRAGLSIVYVDIDDACRGDQMPQIWDELRRKVIEAQAELPPDAGPSAVRDDFGDVYGIVLALSGDGFSYAELKRAADTVERELLLVEDVARVEIWGEQRETIDVEISRAKMAELRVHPQAILETLARQNKMVDAGDLDIDGETVRLAPSGGFQSVDEIGDLVVRQSPAALPAAALASLGSESDLVLLRDVATISRSYLDPPLTMMRFNGKPALGLAISAVSGGNVVRMGEAVEKRVGELLEEMPVGLEIGVVSFQADDVKQAVGGFVANLAMSVAVVVGVLLVTMGLRSGLLIGSSLVLTILGTLVFLLWMGVDMQRTSLGAFIIAMGMLVDNAIVVTEGILVRLQRGETRAEAVARPVASAALPLLGATLVAILAFLPIYISEDATGEYCESLFLVVGISLGLSWVLAMTQTPVFCDLFLKVKTSRQGTDPYAGWPYRLYRRILEVSLRRRRLAVAAAVAMLVAAGLGFLSVDRIFFPSATRAQFMVDYWLPESARIEGVSEDMRLVEAYLARQPEVTGTATFIGAGPPRFYLPYEPEMIRACYGQIVVNVRSGRDIDRLVGPLEDYLAGHFPQAEPRVRRFGLGPTSKYEIEARFSGPDPAMLRKLAEEAKSIMRSDPQTRGVGDDWRQPVKTCVPVYSQARGRRFLASRAETALSLRHATSGLSVGYYREADRLLPIFIKAPREERDDVDNLGNAPVWGSAPASIPLRQVVSDLKTEWEDPIIHRRQRRPTITAQCDPKGALTADVFERLRPKIESIRLPADYRLEWGGQHEDSETAQNMVFSRLPIAMILMAVVVVALFNNLRQPLIILLTLPLSIIGITAGLLLTGTPFGFMALLGAMSLFGMLIKNAVVLLDEVNVQIRSGAEPYHALVQSSISRMRPVMMASLTTVVGMLPLVTDPLFNAMAITIMFGLTFATILTLIVVPVLYAILYRVRPATS